MKSTSERLVKTPQFSRKGGSVAVQVWPQKIFFLYNDRYAIGTFAKAPMMRALVSQATQPVTKSDRLISRMRRDSRSLKKTEVLAVAVAAESLSCRFSPSPGATEMKELFRFIAPFSIRRESACRFQPSRKEKTHSHGIVSDLVHVYEPYRPSPAVASQSDQVSRATAMALAVSVHERFCRPTRCRRKTNSSAPSLRGRRP